MTFPAGLTPVLDIQGAFLDKLEGDAVLMAALPGGVRDHVPENVEFPYIRLGEHIETPDNSHGGFGRDTVSTFHIWSRKRGMKEIVEIANHIVRILDHPGMTGGSLISLPNHNVIQTKFDFLQTLDDPDDPEIRHGVLRIRTTTEQKES